MDKEDTGSGSEPSISDKSVSTKRAESESPEGAESPKPDNSEPPSKIQKQDHTLSVATKDSGTSSESLKEEVSTSESPFTEDETPMEVDEELPSDPKSEIPDKSVTSSENLIHDPTGSDPASTSDDSMKIQDPVATDDNKPSRSPSPQMDVSCQSETSEATLKSKESVTLVEDSEPTLSVSLTSEVSSKLGTDKCLKKQDAIDVSDEDISPTSVQPDVSSVPETEESSKTKDSAAMEDEKLSHSLQSDISSKQSHSDEKMETKSSVCCESADLNEQEKSSENLKTGETEKEKSTAASIPHDLSSEPGPSGENMKTLNQSCLEPGLLCEPGPSGESGILCQPGPSGESGMLCEPGPSGEHLSTGVSTGARPKVPSVPFPTDSFDLDRGVVGDQSLDRETCEDIQAELDPRLSNTHIVRSWNRLREGVGRLKKRHEDPERIKEQGCFNNQGMDREQLSLRGFLKNALPREAEYLNSIAGQDADSVPDPPPLEDDRSYSLSSGSEIPEEDRARWRSAIALGVRLIRLNILNLDCTPAGTGAHPNNCYHYQFAMTREIMNLVRDLAIRINYEFPVDRISDEKDSGNGSSDSPSLRHLPSIQEDDTSLGAASIRSEEEPGAVSLSMEPEVGAVLLRVEPESGAASLRLPEELGLKCGTQSLRPIRSGPVVRLLAEGSFDSVSSESSHYPPDTDTSAYQNQSSSIDFQLPEDTSEATSITSFSMTDNPKEEQVIRGISEVHLLNEDSESVSGFEMNLEHDESESSNYPAECETTIYPTDDDTSSDAQCGYKKKEEKDDSEGWC